MKFKDPHGAHRNAGIPVIGSTWRDAEFDGDDVSGVIFQDCVLERVRLRNTALWQTMFVNTRLDDCEFIDCRLFRTQWVGCSGSGLRVRGGEFAEAVFSDCRFGQVAVEREGDRVVFGSCSVDRLAFNGDGCRQTGLTVSDSTFGVVVAENAAWQSATAVGLDFSCWSMEGATFERCMFVEAGAAGLDLSGVCFESCNLYKGDYSEARIRRAPGTIFAECDCTSVDFAGAELTGALFSKTTAPKARFAGATLNGAMFPDSILVGADFSGAAAVQSVWTGADLTEANFENVDAYRSTFRNGILENTRVAGARLVESDLHGVDASLAGADLRDARGTVDWRATREAEARRAPEA